MPINHPPTLINAYLAEKIPTLLPDDFAGMLRFFPSSPMDINDFTESFPEATADVFAIYDRMFRMRKKPFPHIKCEQILYYFYKMSGDIEALFDTLQMVYELMDNEDETGQDINTWIRHNTKNGVVTIGDKEFYPISFHNFRVFQLQETRDVINYNTTRSFVGSKIIIEYDYHTLNN